MKTIPDHLDLLDFFNVIPEEDHDESGFFQFKVTDKHDLTLLWSLHIIERSLGIQLDFKGSNILTLSSELVSEVKIWNEKNPKCLYCGFEIEGVDASAKIWLEPFIRISWSGIQSLHYES